MKYATSPHGQHHRKEKEKRKPSLNAVISHSGLGSENEKIYLQERAAILRRLGGMRHGTSQETMSPHIYTIRRSCICSSNRSCPLEACRLLAGSMPVLEDADQRQWRQF